MKWMLLVAGILCNAGASILIKMAVMPPRRLPTVSDGLASLANAPLWAGLALYGATFLFYAAALARLPLNIVHPVMTTGSVALVALMSVQLLGETFRPTAIMGVTLVAVGVALITWRTG